MNMITPNEINIQELTNEIQTAYDNNGVFVVKSAETETHFKPIGYVVGEDNITLYDFVNKRTIKEDQIVDFFLKGNDITIYTN